MNKKNKNKEIKTRRIEKMVAKVFKERHRAKELLMNPQRIPKGL